jgi:hypothetical protein
VHSYPQEVNAVLGYGINGLVVFFIIKVNISPAPGMSDFSTVSVKLPATVLV